MNRNSLLRPLFAVALIAAGSSAEARDQIHIVGSSTVYPFASYVGEELGATSRNKTPIIESTGTGGGMKLFCTGAGMDTPDIVNASRRMKEAEFKACEAAGVSGIVETTIGYDGIVMAQSREAAPMALSRNDVLLAIAAMVPNKNGDLIPNPYKTWNQINPKLPNRPILIYGPPTSSGTRDAFEELAMSSQTKNLEEYIGLYEADPKKYAAFKEYHVIRTDGLYVPSGENDNLIVQKLLKDAHAIGIFGYSYLEENADRLTGITIDKVEPTPATIAGGKYPYSRSLYFYIKSQHEAQMPAMAAYINLFLGEAMIGDKGALSRIGLIPMAKGLRDGVRASVGKRTALSVRELRKK